MPDIMDLFGDDPETARMQAKSLADAMRRRKAAGMLGTIVGGPFAAAGKAFLGDAGQTQQDLVGAGQFQANQGLQQKRLVHAHAQAEAQRAAQAASLEESSRHNRATEGLALNAQAQDAWGFGQDANGGGFLYNKKTNEVVRLPPNMLARPDSAGPAPVGTAAPILPGKPSDAQRKAVTNASASMAKLDLALDSLDKNPKTYGGVGNWVAGVVDVAGGTPIQSLTAGRFSEGELQAKNLITNVVSEIINQRAGANVTLREELRQKFLPADTDDLKQVRQKLKDLRLFESVDYEAQSGGALQAPKSPSDVPRIRVRHKASGRTGTIPEGSFTPSEYEKI